MNNLWNMNFLRHLFQSHAEILSLEKRSRHNTDLPFFSGLQPKVPSQLSDELEISFEWFLAPFISASQLNLGPESGRGRTGRCVGITTSLHAAAMSVPTS